MARLAKMTVWDVNLGLAIHIQTPNFKNIVIDLGNGSYKNISPIKKFLFNTIHYMVVTHPHFDHISDILNLPYNQPKVFRRAIGLSENEIMALADDNSRDKYKRYCELDKEYNCPLTSDNENNPNYPDNYGGLKIQTFCTSLCKHDNINNFSVITVLTLGNAKIVICGDNEKESFEKLMKRDDFKAAVSDAYVLVAAHHGRASGYYDDFVKIVSPYVTIVSDGKYCDTSATDRYSKVSKGYNVHLSNGTVEKRYCLTTRNDGNICVEFGETENPQYYSGTLDIKTF